MKAIEINNTCNIKLLCLGSCNITDEHIERLQPCIPYLEGLDISDKTRISFKAMECIAASVMRSIEINNTCKLKSLHLRYCNLFNEHIKALQPCIPYLKKRFLNGNSKMSYRAMKYISDSVMTEILTSNTCNLELIDLSYCNLTDKHIECLQPCIPYLESLVIYGNDSLSDKTRNLIDNSLSKELKLNKTHMQLF